MSDYLGAYATHLLHLAVKEAVARGISEVVGRDKAYIRSAVSPEPPTKKKRHIYECLFRDLTCHMLLKRQLLEETYLK